MNISKMLLKVIFTVVLFHEIQSEIECSTYDHTMFCSQFTLLQGEHLGISNENQKITKIFLYNCSIASIPTGFFMNFTNAEIISMKHVGASMIEPDAFEGMVHLKKLGLSGNDIPELQADMFADLENLEDLELPFNNLIEVKSNTFNSLKKLKFLDLSYNDIEHIHSESFLSLTSLQCLNLSVNNVRELKPGIFDSLKNLAELELNHGYFYTLQKDLFKGLINLKYLSLKACFIHQLDADCFSDMPMLAHLKLGFNRLQNFTTGVFANLQHLEILALNHNEIFTIPKQEIYGLTMLKSLIIDNNKISQLNVEKLLSHLPNLKYVKINNNTWECGSLRYIIDAFENYHVNILDNYTKNQANVDGIACKESMSEMGKINFETSLLQPTTQLDSDINVNNSSHLDYDIRHYIEKFEKGFKNHSAKLTVFNGVVVGISLFVIILLFVAVGFFFYHRNTMKMNDSFTVRYNDVGLMSDCTE